MSPVVVDRPGLEVTAGGAVLPPEVARDVVAVDVHEEVGRHGRCTLVVQNWDADAADVRYGDHGPFVVGTPLAVSLGHHAELTAVFDGLVTSVTARFPERGHPTLQVEARSRSVLLAHPPRSRLLGEVTDGDVVATVAAEHGLSADTADGVAHPAVVADRRTDWDLLTARAELLGWVVYVRGTTLVARPPAGAAEQRSVAYPRGVLELHLAEDLTAGVDGVAAGGWDPEAGEAVDAERDSGGTGLDLGERPAHDAVVREAGWALRDQREESPAITGADEADARAAGRRRDAELRHLHGRVRLAGDPAWRCDSWARVSGVGERLSGPHYVTAARHRLGQDGYTTELQLGRPPALRPPPECGRTPGGGLHLGVVESIDDPAGTNRVRVRLPWRTDGGGAVWARLATLDAGDGYGTVAVPSVGQEVVIGHVDGDAAHPVVLGQLHSAAAPPPVTVAEGNHVRTQVSPGGHRIVLDDGDTTRVELLSAGGNSVLLDDAEGRLVLAHGDSGTSITLSADGIELTAAAGGITLTATAGTVTLDAGSIEGRASGPSSLTSSATLDVSASGTLGLSGALVTIN